MDTAEFKYMINLYFDDELEEEKELLLFTELAKSEELRNYFKKSNLLKSAALHDIKPFPVQLEKKILNKEFPLSKQNATTHIYIKKFSQLLPYAAAIILFILALLYSRRSETYEKQIFSLTREIENQNDKIELLFHALPPIEVTSDFKQTKQTYYNK